MKRDFSAALAFKGKPVKEGETILTLGSLAVSVLLMTDEQNVSADDKFKRFKLAERIADGGVQDVTVEEVALVKRQIGRTCQPIVVGPAYELLETDVPIEAPIADIGPCPASDDVSV